MAYSYIRYTGDGSTTQYTFNFTLGYLTRDDVYAFVDDVSVPFTWVNDGIIDLVTPPVLGAAVLVRRIVDKEELIHDYNDGAVIIEKNLDDSNLQSIMAVHEMLDGFVDTKINETLDMNFNRIINILDPVDVLDAANKQYVDSFINVNVPMDVYEIQSLTSGQTEVVFSNDIIKSAFYLNGDDCDNGRLVEGVDYAADAVAKTITLAQSYPSGTRIILAGLTEVGSTVTGVRSVIDLSDLRSNTGSIDYPTCILQEEGRGGTFNWDSSDLSTEVAADTQSGIYVAPTSDLTGASGAWVRQYEGDVNVKWFGAVGDGVTDDTASVQAALAYSSVFAPAGVYAVNNLTMPSSTTLFGSGHASVLKLNAVGVDVITATNIKDSIIRAIKIECTGDQTVGIQLFGMRIKNSTNISIREVYIYDPDTYGIYLFECDNVVIDRCDFIGDEATYISTQRWLSAVGVAGCSGTTVSNCYSRYVHFGYVVMGKDYTDNEPSPIDFITRPLSDTVGNVISNCVLEDFSGEGFDSNGAYGTTFTGCTAKNQHVTSNNHAFQNKSSTSTREAKLTTFIGCSAINTHTGFYSQAGSQVLITGCKVYRSRASGIYFNNAPYSLATSCILTECGQDDAADTYALRAYESDRCKFSDITVYFDNTLTNACCLSFENTDSASADNITTYSAGKIGLNIGSACRYTHIGDMQFHSFSTCVVDTAVTKTIYPIEVVCTFDATGTGTTYFSSFPVGGLTVGTGKLLSRKIEGGTPAVAVGGNGVGDIVAATNAGAASGDVVELTLLKQEVLPNHKLRITVTSNGGASTALLSVVLAGIALV